MLRFNLINIYRPYSANILNRRTLFGRSSSKKDDFDESVVEQPVETPAIPVPTVAELASYKTKKYLERLVTCRPYTPTGNVQDIIYKIAKETIDNFNEATRSDGNWKTIYLTNPLNKYNLLTRCMKECSHTISNMTLNDIKTLEDVYEYFSTPVSDTNVLEDLQQSSDLPKNVHIQLDAARFTPETSSFFNDLDAFPKRSTKVIDLNYKRKYASYPKNEEDPFKDNIY